MNTQQAAQSIIAFYLKPGITSTKACQKAVENMSNVCNPKTLYHISRGQKPSKGIERAILKKHRFLNNGKDTRPGAIRLSFEGVDPHEARALIVNNLSTLDRGMILYRAAKEK